MKFSVKFLGFVLVVLLLAACSTTPEVDSSLSDSTLLATEDASFDAQSYYQRPMGTFEVTVENLSEGQPFTPPVAATHPRYLRLFILGRQTTAGVTAIAENGDVSVLAEGLAGSRFVTNSLVALPEGDAPPPVIPGQTRSFEIEGRVGEAISFVSMLICSNDGFTGTTTSLPYRVGQSSTRYTTGYDGGTEINTEEFGDIVPPCAQITLGEDQGGTGESNPALAENSVTKVHENIQGGADLLTSLHRWDEPVAKITITRVK